MRGVWCCSLVCAVVLSGCSRSRSEASPDASEQVPATARTEQRKRIERELGGRTSLNPAQLAVDVSNLVDIERELVLPARVSSLRERLAPSERPTSRAGEYEPPADLGFGTRYDLLDLGGGYGFCRVEVVSFHEEVFQARGRCGAGNANEPAITGAVSKELSRHVKRMKRMLRKDDVFELRLTDARVEKAANAARAEALGAVGPVDTSGFEADFERLTSWLDPVWVDERCGAAGTLLSTAKSLQGMVVHERWDLIGAILRGPNRGARLLAGKKLRETKNASPVDESAISELARQRARAETCTGFATPAEILAEPLKP